MRLYELLEAIDGTQSPLTSIGDDSWRHNKNNIFNWFNRPFLTNGPKDTCKLPIKKKKVRK